MYGSAVAFADTNLTLDKMLLYAIQNGYLALSQYESVITAFGDRKPFVKIIKEELQHIDALKVLFATFNGRNYFRKSGRNVHLGHLLI